MDNASLSEVYEMSLKFIVTKSANESHYFRLFKKVSASTALEIFYRFLIDYSSQKSGNVKEC